MNYFYLVGAFLLIDYLLYLVYLILTFFRRYSYYLIIAMIIHQLFCNAINYINLFLRHYFHPDYMIYTIWTHLIS